jgi:HD-GYP domain-containing protein (c-di-GMP phosphodiesterase class II)
MTKLTLEPQSVTMAAPQHVVFDTIVSVDYRAAPHSGRGVHLVRKQAMSVLVAFVECGGADRSLTIKRVVPKPPDRIICEHLSGLFAGAVEQFQLRTVLAGTEVTATAEFEPQRETATCVQKYMFETAIIENLDEIRSGAEARARSHGFTPDHPLEVLAVPLVFTEQQLLELAEAQEQAEWGHVGHGRGVARVASHLASALDLSPASQDEILRAALLHDVGKIGLDSGLWGQLTVLTAEQRVLMQAHPALGSDLAARASLSEPICEAILHHHEHWDGSGYPEGLAETGVSLAARILWIAENVDVMTRATYRRDSLPLDRMLMTLQNGAGSEWDPALIDLIVPALRGRHARVVAC